jgi:hypothetical protein
MSPEEKLLSVIKGKERSAAKEGAGGGAGAVTPEIATDRMNAYISAALKNSFFRNSIFDPAVLRVFNRYMAVALALLLVYILFDLVFVSPKRRASSVALGSAATGAYKPTAGTGAEAKNYSYYSNRMKGKSLFRGGSYMPGGSQEGPAQADEAPAGSLGLVGIVPGPSPQAIIEDKKAQKTVYLTKGQSAEDIAVEDIKDGKVFVDYKGKKLTLFL